MVRRKIKGTKVRRTVSEEEEPNFYSSEWSSVSSQLEQPAPIVDSQPLQKPVTPPPVSDKAKEKAVSEAASSLINFGNFQPVEEVPLDLDSLTTSSDDVSVDDLDLFEGNPLFLESTYEKEVAALRSKFLDSMEVLAPAPAPVPSFLPTAIFAPQFGHGPPLTNLYAM